MGANFNICFIITLSFLPICGIFSIGDDEMILKNAIIYNDSFESQRADVRIEGEYIADIGENLSGSDIIDLEGLTLLPGFIDIHIHGCGGGDMSDGNEASLEKMSAYLAQNGITSFCPASMTLPVEELKTCFEAVEKYKGSECGAYIQGINMEGPFISHEKKGAQAGEFIRNPDIGEFKMLNAVSKVSLVDVAPEVPDATDFAKQACKICTVSAAHTNADFQTASDAFENGFSHATHLFNAMPAIFNREPGTVTAVFDNKKTTAELICDGFHIHPAILRMSFRLLGEDRAVVVSDAMKAAGMSDGEYLLGGQTVYVRDGKAQLANGAIAASTTNMFKEFRNLLSFGIPFKSALKSCTINPAKVIKKDNQIGSIKIGKAADIIAVDSAYNLKSVFVRGKRLHSIK